MFNIKPVIDPFASAADLRNLSDRDIEDAEKYFKTADILDDPNITVGHGVFEYWDSEVEFREYKSHVVSTYDSPEGDRWFVTADGGHLNVTEMVRMLREAVAVARSRAE